MEMKEMEELFMKVKRELGQDQTGKLTIQDVIKRQECSDSLKESLLKYCEQKWSTAKFVSWSQFILTDEIRKIVLLLQPGANGKKMGGIKIRSSWTKLNFKPVFVIKRNVTDEMNVCPIYLT